MKYLFDYIQRACVLKKKTGYTYTVCDIVYLENAIGIIKY